MYSDTMLSVGRLENGFIIEVRVPYRRDDKTDCCISDTSEKQFAVKDATEAAKQIAILLPLLADKYDAAEEFDVAFASAMGTPEE